jgi:hypothetical protein
VTSGWGGGSLTDNRLTRLAAYPQVDNPICKRGDDTAVFCRASIKSFPSAVISTSRPVVR